LQCLRLGYACAEEFYPTREQGPALTRSSLGR